MSEESIEIQEVQSAEQKKASAEKERKKSVNLLENAYALRNEESRPLDAIIGLLDEKPFDEWGESEFRFAFKFFRNVEGPQEQQELAGQISNYLTTIASAKIPDKINELLTVDAPPHELGIFYRIVKKRFENMDEEEFLQKKQEVYMSLWELSPQYRSALNFAKAELIDNEFNRRVGHGEDLTFTAVEMIDANDFPSTGDSEFDADFLIRLEDIQRYSGREDYENLEKVLSKLTDNTSKDIYSLGKTEHKLFLETVQGRLDYLKNGAESVKYGEQKRAQQMAVVSEKRRTFFGGG